MKNKIENSLLKEIQKNYGNFERVDLRNDQNDNSVLLNLFRKVFIINERNIAYVIHSYGIKREYAKIN